MHRQWIIVEQLAFPGDVSFQCAWGPYDDEETADSVVQFLYNATDQFSVFTVVELKARPK